MKTKKFMNALIADVILDIEQTPNGVLQYPEDGADDYEIDLINATIDSVLYALGNSLDNNRLSEVLAVCNKAFNA